jgi:hypothetical protein
MPHIIPLPFDEVLVLIPILTTVEDVLDLILNLIIHLDRVRRGWIMSLDFVALPRGQMVYVEDRMLPHKWREG